MKMRVRVVAVMATVLGLLAGTAWAGTLYWDGGSTNIPADGNGASAGGNGTWNTSTLNWDAGAAPHVAWSNAGNDTAVFGGANGTVSLGEDISLGGMVFASYGCMISGNTLNFGAGGSITNKVESGYGETQPVLTISSAITGSPTVWAAAGTGGGPSYNYMKFAPTNGTVTLGKVSLGYADGNGGDKGWIWLSGTTTGNSVSEIVDLGGYSFVKQDSGTWNYGNVSAASFSVNGGNAILSGTNNHAWSGANLTVSGGTLHYNHPGAVNLTSGVGLVLNGGSLDNSSGAAITTSTYNPKMRWGGSWTFIGSQGAASDLNVGTGAVTLTTSPIVTVSNALTTLTVGGAITDGTLVYGLTKAGAGTLRLTGSNTYNGATTVRAGTLSLTKRCLDDNASVTVSNGAVLNLDFAGIDTVFALMFDGVAAPAGTWGGPGSGAQNETNLLSGTGMLYHSGGLAPAGTWYWDGPNYGGTGDGASAGGSGVWSTSSNNWDQGLVSRKAWNNTTNDKAIFRAVAGTVTLGSDITLGELLIDGVSGYVIGNAAEDNTLNFGGGVNKITLDKVDATFNAGITGSPTVDWTTSGGFGSMILSPPSGVAMALGTVIAKQNGGNFTLVLGGTSAGNSVSLISQPLNTGHYLFVNKNSAGTWTVSGVTANNAGISVDAGKLVLNGTVALGASGSWVTVNSTGTLAGTASITGANVVTVATGGTLAPGNPTGTLTVTNACTINGTLRITVDGGQSPNVSKLAVGGALTITNALLDVNKVSSPGGDVVIASYGSLAGAGTFKAVTNLPAGWSIDYNYKSTKQIALVGPLAGVVMMVQ